ERRPGDRALWRNRRFERREAARLCEALEVGQTALRDQITGHLVVEPVETEHDDPPAGGVGARARDCNQCGGDGEKLGDVAHDVAPAHGRPSMWAGGSMPNRRSTVGAMSTMCGSFAAIERLQKNTPGTSRGSMQ